MVSYLKCQKTEATIAQTVHNWKVAVKYKSSFRPNKWIKEIYSGGTGVLASFSFWTDGSIAP